MLKDLMEKVDNMHEQIRNFSRDGSYTKVENGKHLKYKACY